MFLVRRNEPLCACQTNLVRLIMSDGLHGQCRDFFFGVVSPHENLRLDKVLAIRAVRHGPLKLHSVLIAKLEEEVDELHQPVAHFPSSRVQTLLKRKINRLLNLITYFQIPFLIPLLLKICVISGTVCPFMFVSDLTNKNWNLNFLCDVIQLKDWKFEINHVFTSSAFRFWNAMTVSRNLLCTEKFFVQREICNQWYWEKKRIRRKQICPPWRHFRPLGRPRPSPDDSLHRLLRDCTWRKGFAPSVAASASTFDDLCLCCRGTFRAASTRMMSDIAPNNSLLISLRVELVTGDSRQICNTCEK